MAAWRKEMPDLQEPRGLYINGQWERGGRPLTVVDKFTGATLATLVGAHGEDVGRAVAAAQAAAAHPIPPRQRAAVLEAAALSLRDQADDWARVIVQEGGKPWKDARAEVDRAVETMALSARAALSIHGETIPLDASPGGEQRVGLYVRVPVGVVAAITPFNFPLNLVCHKVAPAIAAGNAVVLKPATSTPLSAVRLVELLAASGLPAGLLNLVVGSGAEVGDALVRHAGVNFITFTGSPPVGFGIKAAAGRARVTLELGNNSGKIVHSDADLATAASLLARRAFSQAGQSCISVQRIYVQASVFDAFLELITSATERLVVGNPLDPTTDVGPLISTAEAERVEAWVGEAVQAGAEVVLGGGRTGALMAPTLLTRVTPAMRVVCDEVFGPVAVLVPYDRFEDAVDLINQSEYGLQAGVFTRDVNRAWYAVQHLRVGGVIINDTSSYRADLMPYGGVGLSGQGREGPRFAVEEMTDLRMAVFNLEAPA